MSLGILSMKSPGAINSGRPLGTEPVILTPTAKKYVRQTERSKEPTIHVHARACTKIREKVSATHCSWQKARIMSGNFAGKVRTLVDSQAVDRCGVHDHEDESPRQLGGNLGPPRHGRLGRPKEDLGTRGGETAMR